MKLFFTLSFILTVSIISAQNKKTLNHNDFDRWNQLTSSQISNDGRWVVLQLEPGYGDPTLKVTDAEGADILTYKRGEKAQINWESNCIIFSIKPELDTLNTKRRNKVKKDDLPKDSLAIFYLKTKQLEKVPRLNKFILPEKWGTHIAFQLFTAPENDKQKNDSIEINDNLKDKKKVKKESEKNGFNLILKELASAKLDTFPFVTDFIFSEKGNKLLFTSTGKDSTFQQGVYLYDVSNSKLIPLCRGQRDYKNLVFDENGIKAAFLANSDTSKIRIKPFDVLVWQSGQDSAVIKATNQSTFLPAEWIISEHFKPYFSKNSERLFFGTSPKPLMQDTMLLPEEIVEVEIWNYKDSRLQTQQTIDFKEDMKKSYLAVFDIKKDTFMQTGNIEIPEIFPGDEGNSKWALGRTSLPYERLISWEGGPGHFDIYKMNLQTGIKDLIAKDIRSTILQISPAGNYIFWLNSLDSSWYAHQNESGNTIKLMDSRKVMLCDEENDQPNFPHPYGYAGWTENDEQFLVYDRYNIWQLDPKGQKLPYKLTDGRTNRTIYRYIKLDKEDRFIDPAKPILLHTFNEISRNEGYQLLNLKNKSVKKLISDNYSFNHLEKAKLADNLIFTKENFNVFPNLLYSDLTFKKITQLSDANPQQKDYLWGTAEIYKWTSLDGVVLEGLLYKPENFDPNKKYSMLVNFYEKSSMDLNRHIAPQAGRSTINYSFYLSRGYVIFNPDVVYKIGYPGESCYNCVIPGVTSLIDLGFIDKKRIGVQGHSWGGYQVAYLITRTDIFAAAGAGAPVPDMVSAYGGIRWWTGLSRMFQYEHTQSRIGGTLWEYRNRYIENSPIFYLDKVNTPLLIMHNDKDGHVPWYQGIELFVAMRRLGKPAWMLNYNDEPHWPQKYQNKKDFNIRMQQFFDHFLKGENAPAWMVDGIPAIEKGINKGYELIENENNNDRLKINN